MPDGSSWRLSEDWFASHGLKAVKSADFERRFGLATGNPNDRLLQPAEIRTELYFDPGGRLGGRVGVLLADLFLDLVRPVTRAPSWRTETVVALAAGSCAEKAFDRMPVLADALEEAGCGEPGVLDHCRGDGGHVLRVPADRPDSGSGVRLLSPCWRHGRVRHPSARG